LQTSVAPSHWKLAKIFSADEGFVKGGGGGGWFRPSISQRPENTGYRSPFQPCRIKFLAKGQIRRTEADFSRSTKTQPGKNGFWREENCKKLSEFQNYLLLWRHLVDKALIYIL
jgi:hypothetical protein